MQYVNCNVLSASDDSTQTGNAIGSSQLVYASFHAYFGDATATGTFKIQASNDAAQQQLGSTFTPINWVDIPSASASITSGGPALITLNTVTYRWLRAVYTSSSGGSTTINVNMMAIYP